MSTDINIRQYLHEVLANKAKARLTMSQFDAILNMASQIQKISQKGLLIVTLTQELHKMSNVNYKGIQKFMNDFLKSLRPQKPRKEGEQRQRRRRRRRPVDTTNVPRDVNEIAQQSISNPSNLQMPRIGVTTSNQDDLSNKIISQNGSKKSEQLMKQKDKDFQYAQELRGITQEISFPQANLGYDQNYEQEPIQQFSRASSSQSFGVVSNYSQKMALLRKQTQEVKKTKTMKKGGEAMMTRKKPMHGLLIDKNLTLQKTKATLGQSFSVQDKSISYQYSESMQRYYENTYVYQNSFDQFYIKIKQNSENLQNFLSSLKKIDQDGRIHPIYNRDIDMTSYEYDIGQGTIDFATQNLSHAIQSVDFNADRIAIQSNIFRGQQQKYTLSLLSQKYNVPEARMFFTMLEKMQLGQYIMKQQNQAEFGQIIIQKVYTQ